jgi:hypothetical protein
MANYGQVAVRKILSVLALAKKFGVAYTDEACAIALEAEQPARFVLRLELRRLILQGAGFTPVSRIVLNSRAALRALPAQSRLSSGQKSRRRRSS